MTRLLIFCVALLLSLPAYAAPAIDQAGADALKTRLQSVLSKLDERYQRNQETLKLTGTLMVEPSGSYYAVTTPSISIISKNGTRNIGMLAINAMPTDNPGIYKVAMAVPTPITDADLSGTVYRTITIGKQTMNGEVLLDDFGANFISMNGNYSDIRMNDQMTNSEMTVPAMTLNFKLTRDKDGFWSGPAEKTLTNMRYRTGNAILNVANLNIKTDSSGIAFARRSDARWPLSTPAQLMIGDTILHFAQSANGTLTASDATYEDGVHKYSVKSTTMQTAMSGLMDAKKHAKWDMKMDGFTTDDPSAAKLMPMTLTSKGSAKNVMLDTLLAPGVSFQKAFAQDGEFTIDSASITSPISQINLNGTYRGDAKLASKGSGVFNLSVQGLEELSAWAMAPGSVAQSMPMLPPILAFLQMTAQPTQDAQGKSVRNYKLEYTKEGRIQFNGNEVGGILQGLFPQSQTMPVAPRSTTSAPAAPKP